MPFVPQVNQTPSNTPQVGGPAVAPMRNFAPEQIQETGQAVSNAGSLALKAGQSIGMRVQEQVDDAKVKSAETQFIQSATESLDGYLNTSNADALSQ
jgi:hypothetical protein